MPFNTRWIMAGAMALMTATSPLASESSVSWLLRRDTEIRAQQKWPEPKVATHTLTSRGLARAIATRTHGIDLEKKPMK